MKKKVCRTFVGFFETIDDDGCYKSGGWQQADGKHRLLKKH
jgi:hypothetical protein